MCNSLLDFDTVNFFLIIKNIICVLQLFITLDELLLVHFPHCVAFDFVNNLNATRHLVWCNLSLAPSCQFLFCQRTWRDHARNNLTICHVVESDHGNLRDVRVLKQMVFNFKC